MPWFRRRKQKLEAPQAEQAPAPIEEAPEAEAPEVEAPEEPAPTGEDTPKTRRGVDAVAAAGATAEARSDPQAEAKEKEEPKPKPTAAKRPERKPERSGGRSGQRRRVATKRAPLPPAKRELVDHGRHRRAAGRRPGGRPGGRGLPRAPGTPLDRRQHLQGEGRQRPSRHGGRIRRDRPREERIPVRRRDRRPRAGGQGRAQDPGPDHAWTGDPRPGGQRTR